MVDSKVLNQELDKGIVAEVVHRGKGRLSGVSGRDLSSMDVRFRCTVGIKWAIVIWFSENNRHLM